MFWRLCIAFGVCVSCYSAELIFAQDPQEDVQFPDANLNPDGENLDREIADPIDNPVTSQKVKTRPAAKKKGKPSWVRGSVVLDGAAVYDRPNFDATVIEYLGFKSPVLLTRKAYPGEGGLGLFHKVRFKGAQEGYIADTDIRVNKNERDKLADSQSSSQAKKKSRSKSKSWDPEEEERANGPLYFKRYLGGAFALVNFTEKYSGRKLSEQMTLYGLRMSGPEVLFGGGPPLDLNVWFSVDQPDYLRKFSNGEPTGFMMFGDIMAQLPLYDGKSTLVVCGLGVMWTYTRFTIPVRNVAFDSQEFRMGLDVGLGIGQKLGKFMLRADVKYYYEKTQYLGYVLSLQHQY